jgi:hypothetical protein
MDRVQLLYQVRGRLRLQLEAASEERLEVMAQLIVGLFLGRNCQLPHIAGHIPQRTQKASRIQRLWRWLRNDLVDSSDYDPFARELLAWWQGRAIELIIDRTDVSDRHYLLYVALAFRGRALPLAWAYVPHRGATDFATQWKLLCRVIPWLPQDSPIYLLGDREFCSIELIQAAINQGWHPRLRVRANEWIQLSDGTWMQLRDLPLTPGKIHLERDVRLTQQGTGPFHIVSFWDGLQDEPIHLACDGLVQKASTQYRHRMGIDEMFSDFKERGFRLEKSRIQKPERLMRLLLVMAICYVWMVQLGAWIVKVGLRRCLETTRKRQNSYFRLGLEWTQECLTLLRQWRSHSRPYP